MVCSGLAALTCRPSWYAPRSIDYHVLDDDKRTQIRLENAISTALNAGRAEEAVLSQDLLNRWIAGRHELWPGEVPSLEPFSRPMIVLEDGNRVRVAATVAYGGMSCVVSSTFRVELDEREIRILPDSAQAGVFPVPELLVEKAVRKLIDKAGAAALDIRDHRLVLRNEWVWPNGKRLFRVAALSISGGELRVTMEPLE